MPDVTVVVPFHEARRRSGLLDRAVRTVHAQTVPVHLQLAEDIHRMGAATTQWLAYAHAVQSSPNRERFGKGAVEGVLGPGAANNSTLGGSLITTVAFGVPASVTMAILLGAFIIQGIVPGPDMLLPPPLSQAWYSFGSMTTTLPIIPECLVPQYSAQNRWYSPTRVGVNQTEL